MMQTKENTRNTTIISTKSITVVAMFTAVLAVMAQISIPMPSGVPVTLQTFAVALTGIVLSWKKGTLSVLIYIILGVIGVPVFSNLSAGIAVIVGKTGGFIWGFLFLAAFCGVGIKMKNMVMGTLLGLTGLVICHFLGVLQFSILAGMGIAETAILVSVPYLLKDLISVILAYILGKEIRKRLIRADLLS